MPCTIRKVVYYHTTVKDQPGEAYRFLNKLAEIGINQLAFTAIPNGPNSTELTFFPENPDVLDQKSEHINIALEGPNKALLVQGADEPGALAKVHHILFEADVNINAVSGITDGKGGYGCLIYVMDDDYDRAAKALGI